MLGIERRHIGHEPPYYVVGKFAPKFHRPECEYAAWIKRKNLVEYSDHEEALAAGKKSPMGRRPTLPYEGARRVLSEK